HVKLMTNRIRLRIDLALAEVDEVPSTPGAQGRRQLLAPPPPTLGSDRARPPLLAPGPDQSVVLGPPAALDA
ncbi:MAG TPA: hypothetical protein VF320_01910, partial [Acidimicrobiales bacterium]